MANILVTITGPSLTGKSVLATQLKPEGFNELVSTTTRPARDGEINGVSYHFISVPEFQNLIKNNAMIEHIQVAGNYYGLSKKSFLDIIANSQNGVVVLEPNGAKEVRKFCEQNDILLHQIFVNNSQEILLQRFLERFKNDSKADLETYAKRLKNMFEVEQQQWVQPALSGQQKYDQVFENFGLESQHEVISEIKKAIDSKLLEQPTNKKKVKP